MRAFGRTLGKAPLRLCAAACAALPVGIAFAADLRVKVPAPLDPWSGFYVGASVGYGTGRLGDGAQPLLLQGLVFPPSVTGLTGSYHAGINRRLGNWVFGLEADAIF